MPTVGIEPINSACERPQTSAFERAATGAGFYLSEIRDILNNPQFYVCITKNFV